MHLMREVFILAMICALLLAVSTPPLWEVLLGP